MQPFTHPETLKTNNPPTQKTGLSTPHPPTQFLISPRRAHFHVSSSSHPYILQHSPHCSPCPFSFRVSPALSGVPRVFYSRAAAVAVLPQRPLPSPPAPPPRPLRFRTSRLPSQSAQLKRLKTTNHLSCLQSCMSLHACITFVCQSFGFLLADGSLAPVSTSSVEYEVRPRISRLSQTEGSMFKHHIVGAKPPHQLVEPCRFTTSMRGGQIHHPNWCDHIHHTKWYGQIYHTELIGPDSHQLVQPDLPHQFASPDQGQQGLELKPEIRAQTTCTGYNTFCMRCLWRMLHCGEW